MSPTSPASAGGFFTAEPPGTYLKSPAQPFTLGTKWNLARPDLITKSISIFLNMKIFISCSRISNFLRQKQNRKKHGRKQSGKAGRLQETVCGFIF